MDKVINIGIPHIGENIFESFDLPGLINCMEVSETWRELAGNVLKKRRNGVIYIQIFEAFKSGETTVAQLLLEDLDDEELFQCALVSETWKELAENVLIKRWKGRMFKACEIGRAKIVQLLLERCNPEEIGLNTKDRFGYTPFMEACENGHKNVVKLFLDHSERIDFNTKGKFGNTAFMSACSNGRRVVVKLLLSNSEIIDLNARDDIGETAFMLACKNGHEDIVKLLLDHSEIIDLNARNDIGETALTIAHQRGHQDIVQMVKPKLSFTSQFIFTKLDLILFLLYKIKIVYCLVFGFWFIFL